MMMMLDEMLVDVCRMESKEVTCIGEFVNQEAATDPVIRHQMFVYR